jgi:hypothetical protein
MGANKMPTARNFAALFIVLISACLFVACPTDPEERQTILDIPIDHNNDSLLSFDSLIVKVYSKDSSFVQEVFHDSLTDPKQLMGIILDSRVGKEFTVSIIGYKSGVIGMHREIKVVNLEHAKTRDLPVKDTVSIKTPIPEILAPSDTTVSEGQTLRFRIDIRNPWEGLASISLKDALPGASLDTVGTASAYAYFSITPTYSQGRSDAYPIVVVYASTDRRIEKTIHLTVRNVNRVPVLSPIPDQKVKENETLTVTPTATDPDGDSIQIKMLDLPAGAQFTAGSLTWKPAIGQAGNYSVKVKAFDGSDSDFTAILISVGDVAPPPPLSVEIVYPARDTAVNHTPITLQYKVNGTLLQRPEHLKYGTNRIFLDTTVAGRTEFDTILITLDTIPPNSPKVKAMTPVRIRTPEWTWNATGGGNGTYRIRLDYENMDSAAVLKDTSFTPPKDLDPGTHTLFVQERDEAGNWSSSGKFAIRIDLTPPNAPVPDPGFPQLTNSSKPKWVWLSGGGDGMDKYRVKLDNSSLTSGALEIMKSEYQSPDSLKEGTHFLYVQERDSAGNWSSTTAIKLIIDITPPSKPIIDPLPLSPLNDIQPTWSWKAGGGGSGLFRWKLDNPNLDAGSDTTRENSFRPKVALSEGLHTLYLQEADSAGNWSAVTSRGIIVAIREVVGTMGVSTGNAYLVSMAFTSGNVPYVAFAVEDDSGKAHVMTLSNGVWRRVGNVASSASAPDLSLAISPSNIPYIAYGDAIGSVKRYVGGNWQLVAADGQGGIAPDVVYYPSIAFGKTDVPYVAFTDWNDYKIAVAYFNDSTWVRMPNSGFPNVRSHEPTLVFSSAGAPHVAFTDTRNGNRIVVMRFNGTTWDRLGGGWASGVDASSPSLAIDPNGVPYLAFSDSSTGGAAKVVKYSGSTWTEVGSPKISSGGASSLTIAINSDGDPYIAFKNSTNSGKAMVMRYHSDKWDTVGTAGLSPGEVKEVSLSLSKTGVPYIAFSDATNNGRVTIMKTSFDP